MASRWSGTQEPGTAHKQSTAAAAVDCTTTQSTTYYCTVIGYVHSSSSKMNARNAAVRTLAGKRACLSLLSGLLLSYSLTTCTLIVAVAFGAAAVDVCAAVVVVKGGGAWCDAYLCVRLLVADVVPDRS